MVNPNTEALSRALGILTRKGPLTRPEWEELLELIRTQLKNYFDKFTLERLADVNCMRGNHPHLTHVIKDHFDNHHVKVVSEDPKLSLDTQGIFGVQPLEFVKVRKNHKGGGKKLWGLSRKGEWLLVEVVFSTRPEHYVIDVWGYETTTKVTIRRVTPTEMLDETHVEPGEIVDTIAKVVNGWVESHRRSLNSALSISAEMTMIQKLCDAVPEPEKTDD